MPHLTRTRPRTQITAYVPTPLEFETQVEDVTVSPWCVQLASLVDKDASGLSESALAALLPPPTAADVSPSTHALILAIQEMRKQTRNTHFRALVFVERRIEAWMLPHLLKRIFPKLEFATVTGHAQGDYGSDRGMKPKSQWEVLKRFRSGEVNVLVATSGASPICACACAELRCLPRIVCRSAVAREGIDIQPCNFVAVVGSPITLVNYIQSRGRARCPGSHYLVILPVGAQQTLESFQAAFASMKHVRACTHMG